MRQYNKVEGMSGVQTWDVQQDTGSKATLLPTEQQARLTRDRLKWLKFWFLVTEKRYKINRQGLGETVCTLIGFYHVWVHFTHNVLLTSYAVNLQQHFRPMKGVSVFQLLGLTKLN